MQCKKYSMWFLSAIGSATMWCWISSLCELCNACKAKCKLLCGGYSDPKNQDEF